LSDGIDRREEIDKIEKEAISFPLRIRVTNRIRKLLNLRRAID